MRPRILAALTAAAALLATGLTVAAAPADAATTCTQGVTTTESVTVTGTTTVYYLAGPARVSPNAQPELKTFGTGTPNGTTRFAHFDCPAGQVLALEQYAGGFWYALSNSISAGTAVTFQLAAANGTSLPASQLWAWTQDSAGTFTFRNIRSGRFLRIPNSGPGQYVKVVAGASATAWTQSAPLARTTALREPAASAACSNLSNQGVTCGSQVLATLPLMLAARNKAVPGSNLVVKTAGASTAGDWESLPAPDPPLTGAGALAWSPGGKQSDLCLARSGGWVVLADCDPASWSQQIITLEAPGRLPGYRMEFRGTSLMISGPNHDAPYRVLVAIPANGKPGQNWEFAR